MNEKYPLKFRNREINWVDNEPKYKAGEIVIFYDNTIGEFVHHELKNFKKEPASVRNIRVCWPCGRGVVTANKYIYLWDSVVYEGGIKNPLTELNVQLKSKRFYEKQAEENEKKAAMYDQIKSSINGELLEDE